MSGYFLVGFFSQSDWLHRIEVFGTKKLACTCPKLCGLICRLCFLLAPSIVFSLLSAMLPVFLVPETCMIELALNFDARQSRKFLVCWACVNPIKRRFLLLCYYCFWILTSLLSYLRVTLFLYRKLVLNEILISFLPLQAFFLVARLRSPVLSRISITTARCVAWREIIETLSASHVSSHATHRAAVMEISLYRNAAE